jgi:hypothetical protein
MRTVLLSLLLCRACLAADGFEIKPIDDKSLGVWEDGRPVLVYNHGMISKEGVPARYDRACYVHPLYGLDGEVITEDFPSDHRHHRGIFWGWPGIRIDGKTYNSWIPSGIHYKTEKWVRQDAMKDRAVLEARNGWYTGETKVADEHLVLTIHAADPDSRAIDFDLTWAALGKPIQLWGAKGKSYGGFTVRYNTQFKDKGGIQPEQVTMTVPSGVSAKDLAVTRLEWADLTAKWPGARGQSGAAVFVHKSHPDYPPTWLTRHYGCLCVGWPGVAPGKPLEPGKPVICRYRVWVHRGQPDARAIQAAYDSYLKGK